jgi:hypothetical protein
MPKRSTKSIGAKSKKSKKSQKRKTTGRKAPSVSAKDKAIGQKMKGNDGRMYVVRTRRRGETLYHVWVPVVSKSKKSKKRKTSRKVSMHAQTSNLYEIRMINGEPHRLRTSPPFVWVPVNKNYNPFDGNNFVAKAVVSELKKEATKAAENYVKDNTSMFSGNIPIRHSWY